MWRALTKNLPENQVEQKDKNCGLWPGHAFTDETL